MTKDYNFTMLHSQSSPDGELIVSVVKAEWMHGIFHTHEEEVFTVFISANGDDNIAWRSGQVVSLVDLERSSDDGFFEQLMEFFSQC